MREIGKMVNNMELVFIETLKVKNKKESGKTENVLSGLTEYYKNNYICELSFFHFAISILI
jgi:hypothetical protein